MTRLGGVECILPQETFARRARTQDAPPAGTPQQQPGPKILNQHFPQVAPLAGSVAKVNQGCLLEWYAPEYEKREHFETSDNQAGLPGF